jgi:hypothetical protein
MPIFRSTLSAVVSIALVLSPVGVANAMGSMQAAIADSGTRTATSRSSTEKTCPCCDIVGKCAAAICTMSCVQLGPASDLNSSAALFGHAALIGVVPTLHQGLAQRPPTPPPRA